MESVYFEFPPSMMMSPLDSSGRSAAMVSSVGFPAGTGIAHQFFNDGDAPFTYLAISNKVYSDVAEFPDSDKVYVRSTRLIARRSPQLEYFDGEL